VKEKRSRWVQTRIGDSAWLFWKDQKDSIRGVNVRSIHMGKWSQTSSSSAGGEKNEDLRATPVVRSKGQTAGAQKREVRPALSRKRNDAGATKRGESRREIEKKKKARQLRVAVIEEPGNPSLPAGVVPNPPGVVRQTSYEYHRRGRKFHWRRRAWNPEGVRASRKRQSGGTKGFRSKRREALTRKK